MELLNQFAPSWDFERCIFGCVFQKTTVLVCAKEIDVASRVSRTKVDSVHCTSGHIDGRIDVLLAEIVSHVLEAEKS